MISTLCILIDLPAKMFIVGFLFSQRKERSQSFWLNLQLGERELLKIQGKQSSRYTHTI